MLYSEARYGSAIITLVAMDNEMLSVRLPDDIGHGSQSSLVECGEGKELGSSRSTAPRSSTERTRRAWRP